MKNYRNNGAVGALLDEYEKALNELKDLIRPLSNEQLLAQKVLVRWGQRYDIEQLFEHAIVHVLRHKRQIERFLLKIS
jgi:hypothetical protein